MDTILSFVYYSSATLLALTMAIGVFMLLTPVFIGVLKNTPGEKDQSGFHLFTDLEEGQAKIVVRGDQLVRCIMSFSDHCFKRVGSEKAEDYWEIEESKGSNEDPIQDVVWFLKPWAYYVFWATGAVFTGIYPFQRVREYTLERTKMKRHESETATSTEGEIVIKPSQGGHGPASDYNITLFVKEDVSDHYRVREFLYPVRIPQADTRDAVSVNIIMVPRAKVTNPHKAAFGIDRWEQKLVNLVTNTVTNYTRITALQDVLSAKTDPSQASALRDTVTSIGDDAVSGFDFVGNDLIDISPNLDAEEKKRLYAEALARPVAEATKLDGAARAAVLKNINEANTAGGEHALETLRTEAQVRMASSAKGGATIFVGSSEGATSNAAILAELQKLNKNLSGGTTT